MSELTEKLEKVIGECRGCGAYSGKRIEPEEIAGAVETALNDLGFGTWRVTEERDYDRYKFRLRNLQVLITSVRGT